ncbi:MAG TPA: hypothetical protein PLW81_07225 [Thiobacillaceae bacterium]|nr:hypothetical protein [Thiobacillaceae bacterium]
MNASRLARCPAPPAPWRAGLRLLGYLWAGPASLLGLALGLPALFGLGRARLHSGVLEIAGGPVGWLLRRGLPFSGPVAAITFGHVVLGCHAAALEHTRRHERVHVAQYERWGGLFLVAYPLAGALAALRGDDPYRDNPFERQARGE